MVAPGQHHVLGDVVRRHRRPKGGSIHSHKQSASEIARRRDSDIEIWLRAFTGLVVGFVNLQEGYLCCALHWVVTV
jgi:hypothetical protein